MTWNTGLVFVEKVDAAKLVDVVAPLAPSGQFVSMQQAMSKVAVGKVRGWTTLWTKAGKAPHAQAFLEKVSKGTRAYSCTLSTSRSVFGFEWWVDGKRLRKAVFEGGEQAEAEGAELRAERAVQLPDWGHDEGFILTVLERLTGITQEDLDEARYEVLG